MTQTADTFATKFGGTHVPLRGATPLHAWEGGGYRIQFPDAGSLVAFARAYYDHVKANRNA